MKDDCPTYSLEHLSLFADGELPQKDANDLEAHLLTCSACTRRLENLSEINHCFDGHVRALTKQENQPVSVTGAWPWPKGRFKNLFGRATNPLSLKLASLGAMALIAMVAVFNIPMHDNPIPSGASPSAIVKSVDTDSSSVMILETETDKHTIIWFSEV